MPITNPDEIETLSPLGEYNAGMIHSFIEENITISDERCPDNPESHEGLFREDGTCFECHFKNKYGTVVGLAVRTFLDPETSPWNYQQFIGRFDPEDWGEEVLFVKGCRKCGTNLRYAQGGNSICVCCAGMMLSRDGGWQEMERWSKQPSHPMPPTNHWDRFLRDIAVGKGDSTYVGRPCERHGANISRYANTGRCCECVREHNWTHYGHRKAAASLPAAASSDVDFDDLFG